jgi:hypothetical protein
VARNLIEIKIDTSQIEALQSRLSEIDPAKLGETLVTTLNQVASETYDLARNSITAGINLQDGYIRDRIQLEKATRNRPVAEIVAPAEKKLMTGLGHYGAMVLEQGTRWSTEDGIERRYKIGPWPYWEPRKGDPGRGFDEGEKARGVSVEVRRGSRKEMRGVFTIPGKEHDDGSPVLFIGTGRPGKGVMDRKRKESRQGVEALYGPSVYQLFRFTANKIAAEVTDNLEQAVIEAAEREFEGILR